MNGKKQIGFRLYTDSQVLEGSVVTGQRRLLDALNMDFRDIFSAEDVRTAGQSSDSVSGENLSRLHMKTSALLFLAPTGDEPKGSLDTVSFEQVEKKRVYLKLGIGPYEISGKAFLIPGAEIQPSFLSSAERFFALADAVVVHAGTSEITQQCAILFVNRQRTDYILTA